MSILSMRIGSEAMKVLICASARAEIVMSCLREQDPAAEITILAAAPVAASLMVPPEGNARLIRLNGGSFGEGPEREIDALKGIRFDTVFIVSGGLGFTGFQNVIQSISGLQFRQIVFYNKLGRRETICLPAGVGRVWERTTTRLLIGAFKITRPIGLLAERIYVRCAELLGL